MMVHICYVVALAAALMLRTGCDAVKLHTREATAAHRVPNASHMERSSYGAHLTVLGATLGFQGRQNWSINNNDRLAFIHIGKCAGTSFDSLMNRIKGHRPGPTAGQNVHADMSFIDHTTRNLITPPRILLLLREPGARAASNVLYWNTLSFTINYACRTCTLSEIINKSGHGLPGYKGAYNDGIGGVCWLAGVCPNGWFIHTHPDGKNDAEKKRRLQVMREPSKVLSLAVAGLDKVAWFGLLEEVDKSMKLLGWQLGLHSTPKLLHSNSNANPNIHKVTESDLEYLRSLTPLDVAFYDHAKKLFNVKWDAYQNARAHGITAESAGEIPPSGIAFDFEHIGNGTTETQKSLVGELKEELPHDDALSDFVSNVDM